jgi:hypothetical protein
MDQDLDYISGAVSAARFELKNGLQTRQIILLGDRHGSIKGTCHKCIDETGCNNVLSMINRMVHADTAHGTDFFFELPRLDALGFPATRGILTALYLQFKDRAQHHRPTFETDMWTVTDRPPIRFHWTDWRAGGVGFRPLARILDNTQELEMLFTWFKEPIELIQYMHMFIEDGNYKQKLDRWFHSRFDELTPEHFLDEVERKEYLTNPKKFLFTSSDGVAKVFVQMSKCSPIVKGLLETFYGAEVDRIFGDRGITVDTWRLEGSVTIGAFFILILDLSNLLVDVYTIARALKLSLGDSDRIVVYAGRTHTERIARFVERYLKAHKTHEYSEVRDGDAEVLERCLAVNVL